MIVKYPSILGISAIQFLKPGLYTNLGKESRFLGTRETEELLGKKMFSNQDRDITTHKNLNNVLTAQTLYKWHIFTKYKSIVPQHFPFIFKTKL